MNLSNQKLMKERQKAKSLYKPSPKKGKIKNYINWK